MCLQCTEQLAEPQINTSVPLVAEVEGKLDRHHILALITTLINITTNNAYRAQ